jgi:hypothetical protein
MRFSVKTPLACLAALNCICFTLSAQQYPPVWTDVMTHSGYFTMASGDYYSLANNGTVYSLPDIRLDQIQPVPKTLQMPVTTLPQPGGYFPGCGNVGFALSFLETNYGWGIRGVGFLGSFNAPVGGVLLNYVPNENLFESVFFNENFCYNGQREYGFFLAGNNSSIWAYWGTNENQPNVVQGQMELNAVNNILGNGVSIQPNTDYYYTMYPVIGAYGSCSFQVSVYDTNFQLKFSAAPPVTAYGASSILIADPSFCSGLASASGYVSANILASPGVSGSLPSTSQLNLKIHRLFVGK